MTLRIPGFSRTFMQIGPYRIDPGVVLAPMAGVTDRPFRQLCKRLGAGLAVSEMTTSDASLWHTEKSRLRRDHAGETEPISVQIAGYDPQQLAHPASAIHDKATFLAGWVVLVILLLGCFALEPLGIPISAISAVCAALLLAIAARGHKISTRKVMKEAPWQIVIFSLGMYLVVYGLRNAGLTGYLAGWLNGFADYGVWGAAMGTGVLTALLSSMMNNLPTVLIGLLSIDASQATGVVKEAMIYANVIGSDLGPKITPIGSLATLLWLHVLERKSIRIGWGYYFRVGIVLTVPVLLLTLAALAVRLSV